LKNKLVALSPDDEQAIADIRAAHPEFSSNTSAIRYALQLAQGQSKYGGLRSTGIDGAQMPDNVSDLAKRQGYMAKAQDQTNIMLVTLLQGLKMPVPTEGDLLVDEEIEAAEKMRKRHMNSVVRQKRHS
jgi:hypothetical protein